MVTDSLSQILVNSKSILINIGLKPVLLLHSHFLIPSLLGNILQDTFEIHPDFWLHENEM